MDYLKAISNLIPPKIRGAAIVATVAGIGQFARVAWNTGVKSAVSAGAKTGANVFKIATTAKYAKAMNIVGAIDLVGGAVVESDVDKEWYSVIPGSGIVELGAGIVNYFAKTNYLNAKFAWA